MFHHMYAGALLFLLTRIHKIKIVLNPSIALIQHYYSYFFYQNQFSFLKFPCIRQAPPQALLLEAEKFYHTKVERTRR
ncbi:hypothetical protein SAMN05216332_1206 [Nitrosospira briensis]|nr:hypothetical protein SAMN05216332_1206 [Nitrosospira briensis]